MLNDLVSDSLSRIRNSLMVKKKSVRVFYSKFIYNILCVILENGYINSFDKIKENNIFYLVIYLKYDSKGNSLIDGIKRISKPGIRVYYDYKKVKKSREKGILIISTNKGVVSSLVALNKKIGGEVVCKIW